MAAPCQRLKETKHWFLLVNKWSIQERYQFSCMLLLDPFRTTHSYFDNSVSICPTSVSHYKWTLFKHTSVHAKR